MNSKNESFAKLRVTFNNFVFDDENQPKKNIEDWVSKMFFTNELKVKIGIQYQKNPIQGVNNEE